MNEALQEAAEHKLTKQIGSLLSEEAFFGLILKTESALAQAQADVGMISRDTANAISAKAHVEYIDISKFPALYEQYMHPLLPIIKLLQEAVGGDNGQYVHYACTTGDILGMTFTLQLRQVWDVIKESVHRVEKLLSDMALKHADTLMVGRTHNIQGLPITFGFKVAGWLSELRRDITRMEQAEDRIFFGQMFGAIGTFASYGEHAFLLAKRFAERLDLAVPPDFCGKNAKDGTCEAFNIFALIAGLMARIAKQVFLLTTTEINELREGRLDTFVGSSAMPQKMNPVNCQHMRGVERQIRYRATHLMEILATLDHEGNMDITNDQQDVCEDLCRLMGEMMERSETLLTTLVVDEESMLRNLNLNHGVILSESVMIELGKHIGHHDAHHIVSDCAIRAQLEHLNFKEVLGTHEVVSRYLNTGQIESLLDPAKYLGKAPYLARQIAAGQNIDI